jgi:hypothetical protein
MLLHTFGTGRSWIPPTLIFVARWLSFATTAPGHLCFLLGPCQEGRPPTAPLLLSRSNWAWYFPLYNWAFS